MPSILSKSVQTASASVTARVGIHVMRACQVGEQAGSGSPCLWRHLHSPSSVGLYGERRAEGKGEENKVCGVGIRDAAGECSIHGVKEIGVKRLSSVGKKAVEGETSKYCVKAKQLSVNCFVF